MLRRMDSGSNAASPLEVVNSKTIHNSATATKEVYEDGGKKIKGRKRFFVVNI